MQMYLLKSLGGFQTFKEILMSRYIQSYDLHRLKVNSKLYLQDTKWTNKFTK